MPVLGKKGALYPGLGGPFLNEVALAAGAKALGPGEHPDGLDQVRLALGVVPKYDVYPHVGGKLHILQIAVAA